MGLNFLGCQQGFQAKGEEDEGGGLYPRDLLELFCGSCVVEQGTLTNAASNPDMNRELRLTPGLEGTCCLGTTLCWIQVS